MTKKIVSKLSIIILILVPLSLTQLVYSLENNGSDTWKTYRNLNHGYQVDYPSTWSLGVEDTGGEFVESILSTVNIGLKDKGSDSKIVEVEFRVQEFPDEIQSLEDLRNHRIAQLSEGNFPSKLLNYSSTVLGGNPAFEISFERPENEFLEGLSVIPARDVLTITTFNATSREAFIISYFAHPLLFAEYFPTVDRMIESFHFTE